MQTKFLSIIQRQGRQKNWRIASLLLALLVIASQGSVVYGQEPTTLTLSQSASTSIEYMTNAESIKVAPDLTLTGANINQARVFLSGNFVPEEHRLGLDGQTGTQGIVGSIAWTYNPESGLLTLSGDDTAANYQAALRMVTYTYINDNSPKPGDRTVEIAIGSSLYNPDNDHFYEFVAKDGITWKDAKEEAANKSHEGRQGYLVTITSPVENDFVASKLDGNGWMGASDAEHDKQWYWVTGPEAGTWFFTQKGYNATESNTCANGPATEQPPGTHYSNWANNEPNDADTPDSTLGGGCAGEEDYAHFFTTGQWNDYPNDPNAIPEAGSNNFWQVDGYVVEYGGMPGDTPTKPRLTGTVTISFLKCHSCGDVHIFTPDGLKYDFQATGEFLAVQSIDEKVVVQARQETWPNNPKVSVNTAVAFMVDGDKVEFYVKPKAALYVNDTETELPSSNMALPKGGSINPLAGNASKSEFYINWPDGSFAARVIMYGDSHLDYGVAGHGNTYEGLLGNFDGNPQNDLQIRGGDQIKPPPSIDDLNRFGDSWRVPTEESESLFRDVESVEEQPHTLVIIEDEKKLVAEKTCQDGGITNELALKNCVYDVALTDDPIFVESAKDVEESVENLPPSAIVPATAGETLGGNIFDADMANETGITIMDGDDLVMTTGTSADGTSFLRFNIYRNGEYVASYSFGTDGDVADALAGAMAATSASSRNSDDTSMSADDLSTLQTMVNACQTGVNELSANMYEYPAEIDNWNATYTTFKEEYLFSCGGIGDILLQNAASSTVEAIEAAIQEAGIDVALQEMGIESWADFWVDGNTIPGIGQRLSQYCPAAHQTQYDCVIGPERMSGAITNVTEVLNIISNITAAVSDN